MPRTSRFPAQCRTNGGWPAADHSGSDRTSPGSPLRITAGGFLFEVSIVTLCSVGAYSTETSTHSSSRRKPGTLAMVADGGQRSRIKPGTTGGYLSLWDKRQL